MIALPRQYHNPRHLEYVRKPEIRTIVKARESIGDGSWSVAESHYAAHRDFVRVQLVREARDYEHDHSVDLGICLQMLEENDN